MNRFALLCSAVALIFAATTSTHAQPRAKPVHIGMAMSGTAAAQKYRVDAFLDGMRDLGYVEGKNLRIDYRYNEGKPGLDQQTAADVVRLKPDVIVVSSTRLAAALKKATSTIPIVVGNAGDLVATGVVASLGHPGGNITGSTDMAADLAAKRLELVKEFVPKLARLGVVWYGQRGFSDEQELKEIHAAARKLGIAVQVVETRDTNDLQAPYAALTARKAEAIVIIQGSFTLEHNKALVELALKHRLPAVCEELRWVENGCLISYGPDKTHSWRRAAVFVDKIVKGAKPADLPVEQPTRFEMAINVKTAKGLGLKVPQTILVRAERVIE